MTKSHTCTAGTHAPFSGDTFTQHSIRGTLTPDVATKRYNIHWLINHFGHIGNGKDGIDCPNPIEPDQEFTIRNGGTYFYDPYTATGGGVWKFYGDYILNEPDEATAFREYMEFCNLMYSNILLPVPQLPVNPEQVDVPWDHKTWKPTLSSDVDLEKLRKVIKIMQTHDGQVKVGQLQRNRWFKNAKEVKALLHSLPEIFEQVVRPRIDGQNGRPNIFYRLKDGHEAYLPESGSPARKAA